MHVLLIDNYDSFTFNLAQLLHHGGTQVTVRRNDQLDLAGIAMLAPDRIVLSPGPGRPERRGDFGVCQDILQVCPERWPVLGVCLGHQGLVHAMGGKVIHAPEPIHGKQSLVHNLGGRLLADQAGQFLAMRYHSLVADATSIPDCLAVTARTSDGLVMAVEHRTLPLFGVQFHPESIGTPTGAAMIHRFLELS
jgi:anthranilate synthase/aminodeoxychorismate synthase-like glutamine amidotransferase